MHSDAFTPCPQTVERIVEWLRGMEYLPEPDIVADAIAAGESWKGDE